MHEIKQKEWRDKNHDKLIIRKKHYYEDNREKIRDQQKKYYDENRDVIIRTQIKYERTRRKTDVNFRLIRNTRRRIHHALNCKSKSSGTKKIGIDIDLYRKWIEYQMNPEMNWSNIEIDHVKAICLFDVSTDEEIKEALNWRNTQLLLKHDHHKKGTKFNFLDYQLQFLKAYQFIKLNEESFSENIL